MTAQEILEGKLSAGEGMLVFQREQIEELRARLQEAEAALREIRVQGKVCPEYELCTHEWCWSSYMSWAIADAYFAAHPEAKSDAAPGTEEVTG